MTDGSFDIIIGYINLGIVVLVLILGITISIIKHNNEMFHTILFFFSTIGIIIIGLPLSIGYKEKYMYYETYETVLYEEIESVNIGYDINGDFVIFSGKVDTNISYYFYIETEYGYELKHISAKNNKRVFLIESNAQIPHVVEKKETGNYAYVQIIVPVGTVIKEYKG